MDRMSAARAASPFDIGTLTSALPGYMPSVLAPPPAPPHRRSLTPRAVPLSSPQHHHHGRSSTTASPAPPAHSHSASAGGGQRYSSAGGGREWDVPSGTGQSGTPGCPRALSPRGCREWDAPSGTGQSGEWGPALSPRPLQPLTASSAPAGRMSPSVYQQKPAAPLRSGGSPTFDLGYHTLVGRPWVVSPVPDGVSAALEPRPPAGAGAPRPAFRSPPLQLATQPPSATEQLLSMYKGRRQQRPPSLERLSDALTLHVFGFLSTSELCACARVCRRWYFLAWEPQLWRGLTLTGETTPADRALRQLLKLLCRHQDGGVGVGGVGVLRVQLSGCLRLTDAGLQLLTRRCQQLQQLQLRGCTNVTDQAVNQLLSRCRHLQQLDLTGCARVTCERWGAGAEAAAAAPLALEYLDLTDCHQLTDAGLQLVVGSCPLLTNLYLRRCTLITDAGVHLVATYCTSLRELSLSDCERLTDQTLHELAVGAGARLRYLSVAKCRRLSDAGLRRLARGCYRLRYLNVRGCDALSDAGLLALARSCHRLRALDLGKCDATDQALRQLSQNCPNLKKLSVQSCRLVGDEGVQYVAYYCRGLQQLNIQDSPVTLVGYRAVKKYCRRCIIEHTNPGFH